MKLLTQLIEKNYEAQVLFLLAVLVVVRTFFAVVNDLLKSPLNAIEIVTDASILFLFLWLLIKAYKSKEAQEISIFYGFLISILLIINQIEFGGALGTARFNFYAGIYLLVMLFSGRRMGILLVFYFGAMVVVTFRYIMPQLANTGSADPTDFIFTLISLAFLTYYLKLLTNIQIDRLESLNQALRAKIKESKQFNTKLTAKHNELEQAQAMMEREIKLKRVALQSKNEAIENYIKFNTQDLQVPLSTLKSLIGQLQGNDTLTLLLKTSSIELNTVVTSIKTTFESELPLDRSKI